MSVSSLGTPNRNGRHERMHLTLKLETTRPPAKTLRAQQSKFDQFIAEFNAERPHEALEMRPPGTRYRPSSRAKPGCCDAFEYPDAYSVRKVMPGGRFRWPGRHLVLVGAPLVGEHVGCRRIDDLTWEIYWRDLLLGIHRRESH